MDFGREGLTLEENRRRDRRAFADALKTQAEEERDRKLRERYSNLLEPQYGTAPVRQELSGNFSAPRQAQAYPTAATAPAAPRLPEIRQNPAQVGYADGGYNVADRLQEFEGGRGGRLQGQVNDNSLPPVHQELRHSHELMELSNDVADQFKSHEKALKTLMRENQRLREEFESRLKYTDEKLEQEILARRKLETEYKVMAEHHNQDKTELVVKISSLEQTLHEKERAVTDLRSQLQHLDVDFDEIRNELKQKSEYDNTVFAKFEGVLRATGESLEKQREDSLGKYMRIVDELRRVKDAVEKAGSSFGKLGVDLQLRVEEFEHKFKSQEQAFVHLEERQGTDGKVFSQGLADMEGRIVDLEKVSGHIRGVVASEEEARKLADGDLRVILEKALRLVSQKEADIMERVQGMLGNLAMTGKQEKEERSRAIEEAKAAIEWSLKQKDERDTRNFEMLIEKLAALEKQLQLEHEKRMEEQERLLTEVDSRVVKLETALREEELDRADSDHKVKSSVSEALEQLRETIMMLQKDNVRYRSEVEEVLRGEIKARMHAINKAEGRMEIQQTQLANVRQRVEGVEEETMLTFQQMRQTVKNDTRQMAEEHARAHADFEVALNQLRDRIAQEADENVKAKLMKVQNDVTKTIDGLDKLKNTTEKIWYIMGKNQEEDLHKTEEALRQEIATLARSAKDSLTNMQKMMEDKFLSLSRKQENVSDDADQLFRELEEERRRTSETMTNLKEQTDMQLLVFESRLMDARATGLETEHTIQSLRADMIGSAVKKPSTLVELDARLKAQEEALMKAEESQKMVKEDMDVHREITHTLNYMIDIVVANEEDDLLRKLEDEAVSKERELERRFDKIEGKMVQSGDKLAARVAGDEKIADGGKAVDDSGSQSGHDAPERTEDPPAAILRARVLFDFDPSEEDEIALSIGDEIIVSEQKDDGWWFGTVDNRRGYFPANYVEVIEE